MSGGSRKHSSKWDMQEESHLSPESLHNKDSWPEWNSPKASGYDNGQKWSVREAEDMLNSKRDPRYSSRESFARSRSSRKDDCIDDYLQNRNGSYSMNMSPGRGDRRQHIRLRSPEDDWNGLHRSRSRSRSHSRGQNCSRSPVRGFRRESDVYGRDNSRAGVSAPLCKDFAVGRCRRGTHCHFSHQSSQSYEDSWESRHRKAGAPDNFSAHDSREYTMKSGRSNESCKDFLKGKCREGASCRYSHHGASDRFSKGSADEVIREREHDRRNRDASFDRGIENEPRRSGDILCKFFAAGNCRNGKYCRFSHSGQSRTSPSRRTRDDRFARGHHSNDTQKSWSGPNTFQDDAMLREDKIDRMDANRSSRDYRLVRGHDLDDVDEIYGGQKWSDSNTITDTAKFSDDHGERIKAPEQRFAPWPTDDRKAHSLDEKAPHDYQTAVSHEAAESRKMEALQSKVENTGVGMGVSESGDGDNWVGDMEMSPDWNHNMQSSDHTLKEEHDPVAHSSQPVMTLPCPDNAVGKVANQLIDLNYSSNILPAQTFDPIGRSTGTYFPSVNSVGQVQTPVASEPSSGDVINSQANISAHGKQSVKLPDINGDPRASLVTSEIQPANSMVSSGQFSQLTDLSASLVQLLGNRQQLPQLYAALNPHNVMQVPSFVNSGQPAQLGLAVPTQPNEVFKLQKSYDPLCDHTDTKKHDVMVDAPGFPMNTATEKNTANGNPEVQSKNFSPMSPVVEPHARDNQPEPGAKCEVQKNKVEVGYEETKKAEIESKALKEDPTEHKTDGNDKTDESKKNKDAKVIRTFKFALVEYLKELLKPAWKEGQINKDAYKNIVKKAADKVTSTMQGPNIPQTQEKIDQYLSFSKPKLMKLVQAYVEKFQKD